MDKNLDVLLKTENDASADTNDVHEDPFKYSKYRIKNICRALCLSSKDYKPERTVNAIKGYLSEKSTRERILYSEISTFVYGLQSEEQGNFATNIEHLVSYALDETNSVDDVHCKIIIKIYDHFQLAINQKILSSSTRELVGEELVKGMDVAKAEISKQITEDVKIDTKEIEKQYITILGIFASVVLSFVGGITFSSSVLQNIDAVSIYRLLAVIDLLAFVLTNTIYILVKFICQINNKDVKPFGMKWLNISFLVFGLLVVVAWLINAHVLSDYISQWLPWFNSAID